MKGKSSIKRFFKYFKKNPAGTYGERIHVQRLYDKTLLKRAEVILSEYNLQSLYLSIFPPKKGVAFQWANVVFSVSYLNDYIDRVFVKEEFPDFSDFDKVLNNLFIQAQENEDSILFIHYLGKHSGLKEKFVLKYTFIERIKVMQIPDPVFNIHELDDCIVLTLQNVPIKYFDQYKLLSSFRFIEKRNDGILNDNVEISKFRIDIANEITTRKKDLLEKYQKFLDEKLSEVPEFENQDFLKNPAKYFKYTLEKELSNEINS